MTIKPILFSAPMIRALIEGRKTQTRRILKPQPPDWAKHCQELTGLTTTGWRYIGLWQWYEDEQCPPRTLRRWPIYKIGPLEGDHYGLRQKYSVNDLLWVREAHALVGNTDPGRLLYRANGYENECVRHGFDRPFPPEHDVKWRPSIHMPRWASRLTLEVTEVRVQRLQDISEADARAEGAECAFYMDPDHDCPSGSYQLGFAKLWETINGPGAWEANPWVAAYTFKVHKANVDTLAQVPA